MKKVILTFLFLTLFSNVGFAKDVYLICDMKDRGKPDFRVEVEINLDEKILYLDDLNYNIVTIDEKIIKAENDKGNIKISINRFDGFMTFSVASSNFAGYCKKYRKIF